VRFLWWVGLILYLAGSTPAAYTAGFAYTCEGGLVYSLENHANQDMVIDETRLFMRVNGLYQGWLGPLYDPDVKVRLGTGDRFAPRLAGTQQAVEGQEVTVTFTGLDTLPAGRYLLEWDLYWLRAGERVNERTVRVDVPLPACS
jgi:hypothetical protein